MKRAQISYELLAVLIGLLILVTFGYFSNKLYSGGQKTVSFIAPDTCQGRTAQDFYNSIAAQVGAKQYTTAATELTTYSSCTEFGTKPLPTELEKLIFETAQADWSADFAKKDYASSKELLSLYLAHYPNSPRASQAMAMIRRSEDAQAGRLATPVPPRTA